MTRSNRPRTRLLILVAGSVLLAGVVNSDADIIVPPVATGTAASYGNPANLINGSGLSGVGDILTQTHQSTHTLGWLIESLDPANELAFIWLGETADLTGVYIWQYEQAGCCTGRGVNSVDVSFSTDGGATYGAPISLSFDSAAVNPGDEIAQTRTFSAQTGVTNVKFTNMTDFPSGLNPGWQGLNEVRFEGTTISLPPIVHPAGLFIDDDVEGNGDFSALTGTIMKPWTGWGGNGVPDDNYFNGLLDLAKDDDGGVGGPDDQLPLEALDNIVPYANDGSTQTVTYGGLTQEGTYTLSLQIGNWSNLEFPTLSGFTLAGLSPDSTGANPIPASGDDEIWTFSYDVNSSEIGAPLDLAFDVLAVDVGGEAGNYMIDHVQIEFNPVPEPSTLTLAAVGLLGLLGCAWRARRKSGYLGSDSGFGIQG